MQKTHHVNKYLFYTSFDAEFSYTSYRFVNISFLTIFLLQRKLNVKITTLQLYVIIIYEHIQNYEFCDTDLLKIIIDQHLCIIAFSISAYSANVYVQATGQTDQIN